MGTTILGPEMLGFPRDYYNVDWSQAACTGADTEAFYEEKAGTAREINPTLRRICGGCPIINDCAAFAIKHERHGFWGGLTPTERAQMRKKSSI